MGRVRRSESKNSAQPGSRDKVILQNEHRTVNSTLQLDPSAAAFIPGQVGSSSSAGAQHASPQQKTAEISTNSEDITGRNSVGSRSDEKRVSAPGVSMPASARTPPMQTRSASDHSVPGGSASASRSNTGSNRGSKRNVRKGGARLDASEFFPSRSPVNPSHLSGAGQGADSHDDLPRPRFDRGNRRKHGGGRGARQTYKKEHFLQASFRFAVSDAVDVAKHSSDADAVFDWDDVLQVEVSVAAMLQCPITLETPPIVPVVTGCGHIFSLPAIVHCMLADDGEQMQAASCPLCHHHIVPRDLRLVTTRSVAPPPDPSKKDQVTFTLIRRPRDSILPAAVTCDSVSGPVDTHTAPGGSRRLPFTPSKGGSSSELDQASPLADERHKFAKFVTCSDALPAMRAAAAALARYAAIIVAAGGIEAEVEGPSLFKSMDILAERARAWTLRRHELLSAGSCPVVGAAVKDDAADEAAASAAAEAEQVVRDVFRVCMADERSHTSLQGPPKRAAGSAAHASSQGELPSATSTGAAAPTSENHERDAAFPALPPARPPATAGGAGAPRRRQQSGSSAGLQEAGRAPMWGGSGPAAPSDDSDHHESGGNSQCEHGSPLVDDPDNDDAGALQFDFDETPEQQMPAAASLRGAHARVSETGSPLATQTRTSGPAAVAAAAVFAIPQAGGGASDSGGYSGGRSGRISEGFGQLPADSTLPVVGSMDESIRLLGSSPHAGVSVNQMTGGDYFMYQVSDGSWLFLHPINVRALLQHHGSFKRCPATLRAIALEVEAHSQSPTTRRKLEPMAHIPITSEFRLVEIDLTEILPEDSIAPFQKEIAARAERRERERAKVRQEEERARAAEARARKPGVFLGLDTMPLPHEAGTRAQQSADYALAMALASSPPLATQEGLEVPSSTPVATTSTSSVSYAQLARLGYAAPTGPVVGQASSDAGLGPPVGGAAAVPLLSTSPPVATSMGAWGACAGSAASKSSCSTPPLKGAWGRKTQPARGAQGVSPATQGPSSAGGGAAAAGRSRWGAGGTRSSDAAVATGEHATKEDPEPVVRRNKKGHKVVMLTHGGRI